jgi:hypothetical protein
MITVIVFSLWALASLVSIIIKRRMAKREFNPISLTMAALEAISPIYKYKIAQDVFIVIATPSIVILFISSLIGGRK